MHDLARPNEEMLVIGPSAVAAARSRSVRFNPAPRNPRPPMRITSRRFQPSQRRTPGPSRRSIGASSTRRVRRNEKQLLNKADSNDIGGSHQGPGFHVHDSLQRFTLGLPTVHTSPKRQRGFRLCRLDCWRDERKYSPERAEEPIKSLESSRIEPVARPAGMHAELGSQWIESPGGPQGRVLCTGTVARPADVQSKEATMSARRRVRIIVVLAVVPRNRFHGKRMRLRPDGIGAVARPVHRSNPTCR